MSSLGMCALAAAIAVSFGCLSSIGESLIICHAIDGMARNPEMQPKLQSTMIIGVALDESTAIYCLVVAILILFVTGGSAVA
jgi:F-type H+-transporting ATPase subunit c